MYWQNYVTEYIIIIHYVGYSSVSRGLIWVLEHPLTTAPGPRKAGASAIAHRDTAHAVLRSSSGLTAPRKMSLLNYFKSVPALLRNNYFHHGNTPYSQMLETQLGY